MSKDKEIKGITLIALVVTIVILLILAGIVIIQLNNNGLFKNTKIAKEKYTNSQENENAIIDDYSNQIDLATSREEEVILTKAQYDSIMRRLDNLEENRIGFIDYNNVLATITSINASYTATENCAVVGTLYTNANSAIVYVNGIQVDDTITHGTQASVIFLHKGDVYTTRNNNLGQKYDLKVYALK